MEEVHKLSTKEHWDKVLNKINLPIIVNKRNYNHLVTMRFVDNVLRHKNYQTFMEVGCGSSAWMPYFAKKYNYKVSGVDYSEIGCRIANENLKFQGIDVGEILCADIFDASLKFSMKFDVIFSYGFIEHFSEPEKIIQLMKTWLSPSGVIITLVPNLFGFTGWLSKTFSNSVFKMHIPIDKITLGHVHSIQGLVIVENSYAGIFSLAVIPWANGDHWLLKRPFKPVFRFMIRLIDFGMGLLLRFFPAKLTSKTFSPYIICVAKG